MISARIDRLADRLFREYEEAEVMTTYHYHLVRIVLVLDALAPKLRRRGL